VAELIIQGAAFYLAAGAALALAFLVWGIDRIDPGAVGAYAFRPLLFPGAVLLWPWVAVCWAILERRHRVAADPVAPAPRSAA
jgi:hypothetical protein